MTEEQETRVESESSILSLTPGSGESHASLGGGISCVTRRDADVVLAREGTQDMQVNRLSEYSILFLPVNHSPLFTEFSARKTSGIEAAKSFRRKKRLTL